MNTVNIVMRLSNIIVVLLWISDSAPGQENSEISQEQRTFFEQKIRPILVTHCYECHSSSTEASGDLLLDSRTGLLQGGASGAAVVPKNPQRSLLLATLKYSDPDLSMPPPENGGKLPQSVIEDFERWILMGAPDPRVDEVDHVATYDSEAAKDWWSYQPLTQPAIPSFDNSRWPITDIDRFVLANLESQGLVPVETADKAALLRRVFLDLAGLPPTPRLQREFEASNDPEMYTRIVDWLLEQPQFGQRWGRHWLDVARYAESTGRGLNLTTPEAWRYRDYVIQSLNDDKPFDDFIREQIAGDLMPSTDEAQRVERLIATGFLAVGPKEINQSDPRQFAVDLADEQIDAVSQAFLGMTISCARCHDHKFDPITQVDYTAIAGIFLSTETHYGTPGGVRARNASDLIPVSSELRLDTLGRTIAPDDYRQKQQQLAGIRSRLDAALQSRAPRRRQGVSNQPPANSGSEISGFDIVRMMTRAKQLEVELAAFNPDGSARPLVMGVTDKPARLPNEGRPRQRTGVGGPNASTRTSSGFELIADSPLFLRGSIENEADRVARGLPEFLAQGTSQQIPANQSGRLQLANWIASSDNRLTSRVIVNRVWYWLMGSGLVETVDNFGASGAVPSDPKLLDYLATRFMEEGWSIKRLIREIVLSRVYQLDTKHNPNNFAIDPDNRSYWRANSRRLDAESIRDGVLWASGNLKLESVAGSPIAHAGDGPIGGDRMQAIREEEIANAQGLHRSVYLPIARGVQPEFLSIFDFANPNTVLGARSTTIVPSQSLYLMNSEFMQDQSQDMARRVMEQDGFENRFELACRLVYCRAPHPEELEAAKRFPHDDLADWTSICRVLLSSAEFIFVD